MQHFLFQITIQTVTAGADVGRGGGLLSLLLPHRVGTSGSQPTSSNPNPSLPTTGSPTQNYFLPGSPSPSEGCSVDALVTLTSLSNRSVIFAPWPSPLNSTSLSNSLLPYSGRWRAVQQIHCQRWFRSRNYDCDWLNNGLPRCPCSNPWNRWICYLTW